MIKVWIGTGIFLIATFGILAFTIITINLEEETPIVTTNSTVAEEDKQQMKEESLHKEKLEPVSYHDGPTLSIDQTTFTERFNTSSETFKIDDIDESNKNNNLYFVLTNGEASSNYYLTALNNPETDQLVQVSLSITGVDGLSAKFNEKEWLKLANAVYAALQQSPEEITTFEEQISFKEKEVVPDSNEELKDDYASEKIKQRVWRNKQHDVYLDRTNEGAVLGIYPANTFSDYVFNTEKADETKN